jgi:Winged helix-turn helix
MDKYRITLTWEERTGLEQVVSAGKSAARKLPHARILLLADEWQGAACSDAEIVSALGVSLRTSERVRQRLVTEGGEAALDPRPHPPRPDKLKLKGDVEQQ